MVKRIIYASFHCSEKMFEELFRDSDYKPGQAVQKYNRLLVEGLAKQEDIQVIAISELPITEKNYGGRLFRRTKEEVKEVKYIYIPLINVHRIKDIFAVITSFFTCLKQSYLEDVYYVSDILNAPVALGAYMASRICRKKYIAVITDAPRFVYFDSDKFYHYISDYLIKKASGYVFLTEQMNKLYNSQIKPYVIIEGIVDNNCEKTLHRTTVHKMNRQVCMYTGSIHQKYGIGNLVQGFIDANIDGAELHIYGDGDFREQLEVICKENANIVYFGNVLNSEVINRQQEATILVNPRPPYDEFTKYSFPSKIMEYMVSGTPVLMTRLPGMQEEYLSYVYLIEDASAVGIMSALKAVLSLDESVLMEKGINARDFVLSQKNNIVQAEKLVSMLEDDEKWRN